MKRVFAVGDLVGINQESGSLTMGGLPWISAPQNDLFRKCGYPYPLLAESLRGEYVALEKKVKWKCNWN